MIPDVPMVSVFWGYRSLPNLNREAVFIQRFARTHGTWLVVELMAEVIIEIE